MLQSKKQERRMAVSSAKSMLAPASRALGSDSPSGKAGSDSDLDVVPAALDYSGAGGRPVKMAADAAPSRHSSSAASAQLEDEIEDQEEHGALSPPKQLESLQRRVRHLRRRRSDERSTKTSDRHMHLALIASLSTPSPFLGLSKEPKQILKGATPPDASGKWTSRREQALDGFRRAIAQSAIVSSAMVRCEEGGSRTRLASFAVETLLCEPEPTWLIHAAAFAAREEEAWKRRHERKHTFEIDTFRHEWNTMISVLFKPFSRAWQTYKYIRGWENPALSAAFLCIGLVLLWSDLTVYWPIMMLSILFLLVLFNGALGRN